MTNVNIKVMGISRATVNAYLAEACNRGITVSIDPTRLGAVEVAQALRQRFNLDGRRSTRKRRAICFAGYEKSKRLDGAP